MRFIREKAIGLDLLFNSLKPMLGKYSTKIEVSFSFIRQIRDLI